MKVDVKSFREIFTDDPQSLGLVQKKSPDSFILGTEVLNLRFWCKNSSTIKKELGFGLVQKMMLTKA